jgi:riboflavin synthase alpha subunit
MTADEIVISDFSRDNESATILNQYVEELRKIYAVSQKPVMIKLDGDFLTLNPITIGEFSLYLIKYTNDPHTSETDFTKPIPLENINNMKAVLSNFFRKID